MFMADWTSAFVRPVGGRKLSKEGQRDSGSCSKFRKHRGVFSSLEISKLGEDQPW